MNVLNHSIVWLVLRSLWYAISEPRHFPQYVHDSVSNVSHLPPVNYWVQRWVEVHYRPRIKQNSFKFDIGTTDVMNDQTDSERQITNQKHNVYVEGTDRRFNKANKNCHFAVLCNLLNLQGLNLIPVALYCYINSDVGHCCNEKTNNSKK